jgi:hypothetical protein
MAHHKRHRPRVQRAGCWCKAEKKLGIRELRGGETYKGRHGRRGLVLAERAQEAA